MKIFTIILMLRKIYVSQKYRVFFSKITTHVYHKLTLKKTNKSLLVQNQIILSLNLIFYWSQGPSPQLIF